MSETMEQDDLDSPDNNAFDKDKYEKEQKALKDLKSRNLKNVFGTGTGRLALIVLVTGFVLLAGIGFYNLFKRKAPAPEQVVNANGAILSTPTTQGDIVVTSEAEAKLRIQAANQQSEQADKEGKAYIAPPIIRADSSASVSASNDGQLGPNGTQKTPSQNERDKIAAQNQVSSQANAEAADRAMRANLAAQNFQQRKKEELDPQMLAALGRNEGGGARQWFSTGSYALPDRTPKPIAQTVSAGGTTQVSGVSSSSTNQNQVGQRTLLAQAGDGYYCESRTKINTDAIRSDVFAECFQGKLNGATLIGKFEASKEGASEGSVSINFSLMSLPGKPAIPIQAIAIDDDTGESGMADEVNDHSIRKYGGMAVASILRGFGKAASIVTGSTTVVNNGATSTTQIVTDPITPARQAKIAAGEVGISLGDSLQKSSDQLKRTIKVNNKKGLRVLFLTDVFEEKK